MTNDKQPDRDPRPPKRDGGQEHHAGVAHSPEEFDAVNPAKMKQPPADPPRKD